MNEFKQVLTSFTKSGKEKPIAGHNVDEINMKVESKINAMGSKDNLIKYVIASEASTGYKKRLGKDLIIEKINECTTINMVLDYVKTLRSEQNNPIRQRHKYLGLSFWGYRDENDKVSKTWSDIIKAAKNKIMVIALGNAKNNDFNDINQLLNKKSDWYQFINKKRYFSLRQKTSTVKFLEESQVSLNLRKR